MAIHLDSGFYINLFEISIPEKEIRIMRAERSKYSDLRELRNEIAKAEKEIFVYAPKIKKIAESHSKNKKYVAAIFESLKN
uniref:Uncharacterized protein n=1 Tax=Thermosphaera aggregans TaxID=54254 RepID=A0A7C2BLX1_9CREN